jgi:FkbM family methyltransferase
VFQAIKSFMRPFAVAYDIGANEGIITAFIAKASQGTRVFAFEPVPENLETLNKNAVMNGCLGSIVPIAMAVSNRVGTALFHRTSELAECHLEESGFGELDSHPTEVFTTTLDHFIYGLGNPAPDLIKIDVEGAAALVLKGATELLSTKKPILIIELHDLDECEAVGKITAGSGYTVNSSQGGRWDHHSYSHFIVCRPASVPLQPVWPQ